MVAIKTINGLQQHLVPARQLAKIVATTTLIIALNAADIDDIIKDFCADIGISAQIFYLVNFAALLSLRLFTKNRQTG